MRTRYKFRRIVGILSAVLLLALAFDYQFYPWGQPFTNRPSGNNNENGLWLHYTWYFGKHSPEEVTRLAQELTENQIRYAYFHVRYIGKSGKLRYRYPEAARHLNTLVHKVAPSVKSIAYVYVGNTRGIGSLKDLSDASHRKLMVEQVRFLVTECGFDGVQWDYEICPNNDQGLLSLLEETRVAIPKGKIISIATALWSPEPIASLGYGWTNEYFSQVAARCDQICIMGYDSGIYLPRAYAWLISEQVRHTCSAVIASGNPNCRVLIGVPTYDKGGASHHAHAENLSVAIRGVRSGYDHLTDRERTVFAGIAPFAEYTTDTEEWALYHQDWLREHKYE